MACMVDSSLGVWVTLKGSAHVCLYHADTFEQLAEVDVTPPVHRMLAGTDLALLLHLPWKAVCPVIEEAEPGPAFGPSAGLFPTQAQMPSSGSTRLPACGSQRCWYVKSCCGWAPVLVSCSPCPPLPVLSAAHGHLSALLA